jgi:AmiR/NasT family two-component response regulator
MATKRCTSEQAFDLMRRASQRTHQKLRDIAEDILLTGTVPEQ